MSHIEVETLKSLSVGQDKRVPYSLREIVTKLKDAGAKNVVTMVGAGISTAAGIPDFRSSSCGLYSQDRMKNYKLPYNHAVFENSYFEYNPEPLYTVLKESMLSESFKPTKAHYFMKLLEEKGVLRRHYTQNIDGLDRLADRGICQHRSRLIAKPGHARIIALLTEFKDDSTIRYLYNVHPLTTGIASDKLIEAHGTLRTSHCTRCQKEYSLSWLRTEVNNFLVPKCSHCTAVVKPDIVLFGDPLPDNFREKISSDYAACDLLIVMGTSLVVEPFASLITSVPAFCPRLFINKMPLGEKLGLQASDRFQIPNKQIWLEGGNRDTIMHGECDDCVEELARMVGWQNDLQELIKEENPDLLNRY